jgi:hypothetical protein
MSRAVEARGLKKRDDVNKDERGAKRAARNRGRRRASLAGIAGALSGAEDA